VALDDAKQIDIIAGPNGSGKTTFARAYVPAGARFVNADLIAAGLAPLAPESVAFAAGRLMLSLIAEHTEADVSFAFETTLAGRNYTRWIPRWRDAGYHVRLHFLSLPSPEIAIERVRVRMRQGGHAIPEAVVRRRFAAGRTNFEKLYKPLVSAWTLYDNTGERPLVLDHGEDV
jgi:predicted ABC-type ATPase